MKVVVAGGTGVVGSRLVDVLRRRNHDVRIASRASGVDVVTGQGLDEIMVGADVVVDVLNAPAFDEGTASEAVTAGEVVEGELGGGSTSPNENRPMISPAATVKQTG
mgnify:CR=1 FL=1